MTAGKKEERKKAGKRAKVDGTSSDVVNDGVGLTDTDAVDLKKWHLPEGRLAHALEVWPPLRPTTASAIIVGGVRGAHRKHATAGGSDGFNLEVRSAVASRGRLGTTVDFNQAMAPFGHLTWPLKHFWVILSHQAGWDWHWWRAIATRKSGMRGRHAR